MPAYTDQIVLSDSFRYRLTPTQMQQSDSLAQSDAYRLVMAGSAGLVIEIGERLALADAFSNPNVRTSQVVIEIVNQPTGANARLTQAPIEVLRAGVPNARVTQVAVELVAQKPAGAFIGTQINMIIN